MSWVAGIDYSTHAIDIVLVDLDDIKPPTWHRFPLAGQDSFDRTRSVRESMPCRTSLLWDDCLAVGVEHPAGKFGTGPLMRIQGAVLACLPVGVLVQPWPPAAWRKAVGLPGNATKQAVSIQARIGAYRSKPVTLEGPYIAWVDSWPQDACDAYCIALATRQAITREVAA